MIKTTNFIKEYKVREYYKNMIKNRQKKDKKIKKLINDCNKSNIVYNFGVDKVYQLEKLHKKINWFKYFLDLYIAEYLDKIRAIKSNKINLE